MWWKNPANIGSEVDYSFFIKQLENKNVAKVKYYGDRFLLTGEWVEAPSNPKTDGGPLKKEFHVNLPRSAVLGNVPLLKELLAKDKDGKNKYGNIEIKAVEPSFGPGMQLMMWMLPLFLILGIFWFIMRRSSDPFGGGGMMGNFVKSQAKRFFATEQRTTYDDVAGMDESKKELTEVVEFLKTPEKFQKLGAQIPKGVLLMGPPGTGKTLLARATAGEAGVPFYSINGSEFIQMFVGVGASRVRDLFRTAKENAPCIIFIDEIDAVGRNSWCWSRRRSRRTRTNFKPDPRRDGRLLTD